MDVVLSTFWTPRSPTKGAFPRTENGWLFRRLWQGKEMSRRAPMSGEPLQFRHGTAAAGRFVMGRVMSSSDGKYLYVTSDSRLTSSGRTWVIPMPQGFAHTEFPPKGLDRASDEELARFQVIRQGLVSPGPDPQNYAFVTAAFQGNLFRIPLH